MTLAAGAVVAGACCTPPHMAQRKEDAQAEGRDRLTTVTHCLHLGPPNNATKQEIQCSDTWVCGGRLTFKPCPCSLRCYGEQRSALPSYGVSFQLPPQNIKLNPQNVKLPLQNADNLCGPRSSKHPRHHAHRTGYERKKSRIFLASSNPEN